jgi:hypothetical protein
VLKTLAAQKFTLGCQFFEPRRRYFEFDPNYGAYPKLPRSMRRKSLAPGLQHGVATDLTIIHENDRAGLSWQETDGLTSDTIPFYNFVRELFYRHIYFSSNPALQRDLAPWCKFHVFPVAPRSDGATMRDCPFCFLRSRHCGYHNKSNHSTSGDPLPGGSSTEHDATMIEEDTFKNM